MSEKRYKHRLNRPLIEDIVCICQPYLFDTNQFRQIHNNTATINDNPGNCMHNKIQIVYRLIGFNIKMPKSHRSNMLPFIHQHLFFCQLKIPI